MPSMPPDAGSTTQVWASSSRGHVEVDYTPPRHRRITRAPAGRPVARSQPRPLQPLRRSFARGAAHRSRAGRPAASTRPSRRPPTGTSTSAWRPTGEVVALREALLVGLHASRRAARGSRNAELPACPRSRAMREKHGWDPAHATGGEVRRHTWRSTSQLTPPDQWAAVSRAALWYVRSYLARRRGSETLLARPARCSSPGEHTRSGALAWDHASTLDPEGVGPLARARPAGRERVVGPISPISAPDDQRRRRPHGAGGVGRRPRLGPASTDDSSG